MFGMIALNRLAGRHGDGLHPRLAALLEERLQVAAASRDGVVAMEDFRGHGRVQAGPSPAGALPAELPENVVRFAARPHSSGPNGRTRQAKI